MGIIVFNHVSSMDYGIQVEHPPKYETPEKDYEVVHVPGRNGDIFIDKGSFKNVPRTYDISIGSEHEKHSVMANRISEWLHSASGYARLEDTYEPEYYRLAVYKESCEITNIFNHAGRTTIEFDCKPQRFLKLGDRLNTFTKNGVLRNPTIFASSPIITIYGTGQGTLKIGNYVVTISDIKASITIDSELQDSYSNTINRNADVILSSGFPKLSPGKNEISFAGGINKVEVIPKWWTI